MWNYYFSGSAPGIEKDPSLHFIEFSRSVLGQNTPFHSHPDYHVLFCTGGEGFLRIHNVEFDLKPGTVAAIPAWALHSCGSKEEGLEFWGISFTPTQHDEEIYRFLTNAQALTADFSEYLDYVRGAFFFIYDTAQQMEAMESPEKRSEAECMLQRQCLLLLYFAKNMFLSRPYQHELPKAMPMDKVVRWMMEHYAEDISLDSLSARFSLSPSHFSRKFQETFHISPINYLIDYRIGVAKDLLIHTDKPVARIAAEVGYDNPYHFSSLFSRRTGLTPQQMRSVCRRAVTQPKGLGFQETGEDN